MLQDSRVPTRIAARERLRELRSRGVVPEEYDSPRFEWVDSVALGALKQRLGGWLGAQGFQITWVLLNARFLSRRMPGPQS